MNVFLKPRTNWKNLCFIFSLVFFITGIFVGKSFADQLVYNLDNNPIINQPAKPLIPNKNTIDFTASASLTDGGENKYTPILEYIFIL